MEKWKWNLSVSKSVSHYYLKSVTKVGIHGDARAAKKSNSSVQYLDYLHFIFGKKTKPTMILTLPLILALARHAVDRPTCEPLRTNLRSLTIMKSKS